MKRFIPLVIFVVMGVFLYAALWSDSRKLPSPFIDKAFPDFTMTTLAGAEVTSERLKNSNTVSLVNVWASWCPTCRVEHEVLMLIAATHSVDMIGINYKDTMSDAMQYLQHLGNPFTANIFDPQGVLGLDLGVYATPETFVVDKQGVIRYKHIGEITHSIWLNELKPLIKRLNLK